MYSLKKAAFLGPILLVLNDASHLVIVLSELAGRAPFLLFEDPIEVA